MTPLNALLDRIGWTLPEMTRRFGLTRAVTRPWADGHNSRGNPSHAPADVLAKLERVAVAVERALRE